MPFEKKPARVGVDTSSVGSWNGTCEAFIATHGRRFNMPETTFPAVPLGNPMQLYYERDVIDIVRDALIAATGFGWKRDN